MRQSLIRVLHSPTRTTVSHYLQIHAGPAPGQTQERSRLTNSNQWPNAQPRLMCFSLYTTKYRRTPCVGCSVLCMRLWTKPIQFNCDSSCGFRLKKKERKEVVFGVDNRALNHIATQVQTKDLCAYITSRIFIPQGSKQLHLKCSEKCKAAAQ